MMQGTPVRGLMLCLLGVVLAASVSCATRPQQDGAPTGKPVAGADTLPRFPVSLGWLDIERPGTFVIGGSTREGDKDVPLRIVPGRAPKAPVNMTDLRAHVDSQLAAINQAADALLGESRKASYSFYWSAFDNTHNKAMFEYNDNDGDWWRKAFVIVDPHTARIERVLFTGRMPYMR